MNYSTPITPPSTGGGTGTVNKITFNGVEFLPDPTGNVPIDYQGFSGNYSDLVGAPVLAAVATSGSYNDLTERPVIPAAQVNSDWNATTGVAQILNKPTIPTVPTNVSAFINDAGYLDAADIAPVGLSGNYADLINKPDLSPLATAIQNAANIGTGTSLVSGKTGTNLDFRTLRAGDNVTLGVNAQGEIVISSAGGGTASGEANTASSLGTGVSLVAPKNGVDLPFRSLLSSAGLTWSQETNTVTLTLHSILQAWSNLTLAADTLVYATGAGTLGTTPLTAFARTLLDDANAAAMQNTLALALVASSGSYADLSNKPDLSVYAPKASPIFTGNPTAPTAAASDNDTTMATTAFVRAAMALFGLGVDNTLAAITADADTLTASGTYWLNGASPNKPVAESGQLFVVAAPNGATNSQLFFAHMGSAAPRIFFRHKNSANGTWNAWGEIFHTGNFDPATKQDKAEVVELASSKVLALSDASKFLWGTTGTTITITIPTNTAVAFPVGTEVHVRGLGPITLVGASGVTVTPPNGGTLNLAANMTVTIKKVRTDWWLVIGQTVAA